MRLSVPCAPLERHASILLLPCVRCCHKALHARCTHPHVSCGAMHTVHAFIIADGPLTVCAKRHMSPSPRVAVCDAAGKLLPSLSHCLLLATAGAPLSSARPSVPAFLSPGCITSWGASSWFCPSISPHLPIETSLMSTGLSCSQRRDHRLEGALGDGARSCSATGVFPPAGLLPTATSFATVALYRSQ